MSIERMLTIKRVPTVLSNYQENASSEDLESKARGCGRNCLGKCCLPVSKLPTYAFKNVEHEMVENGIDLSCGRGPPMSFLNNLLLGQWEERMSRGLFRYDVTTCETKVIPGRYGFIAQLNEGRHLKKRATEFRIDQVLQPFDDNKFNFTKVGQEEVLFRFEPSKDNEMHYFPSSAVDGSSGAPNVVAINVSPIEYGHVLLIPRVLDCFPQKIDHESFLLALHLARETADPAFRVGYNSLGAFATINHLHFQAYYLALPLPIEKAPTCRLMIIKEPTDTGVSVSKLLDYPVSGLVFEGECTLHNLSDAVANSCVFLQNSNIPFNVLIADCGRRIFLLPQCYAKKQALGEVGQELLDTQVNPAVWEISGHIVLKRKKDYDEASEQYAWSLLSEVSLSEKRFQELTQFIAEAAGFLHVEDDVTANRESGVPRATSHLPKDCLVQH
ncbi:GDP-L-galactose phosphorylase 1-like [Olea europaea subsp. europaea]|uniref:GDP-D-glucose phosphorylase 1 n=2 Tax=Olea europaea subsp. europaea TaxID=158383 RepID=A0A8S0U871_OLEEU|nr:GDP-L-galactose phosphorylase 1-like [Olea europaea subsp. europaea]